MEREKEREIERERKRKKWEKKSEITSEIFLNSNERSLRISFFYLQMTDFALPPSY